MVSTDDVKRLREVTGAGVMDSKRALEQAGGDFDRAREILREQGAAAAAKRSERATSQGLVESYIHGGGRIGALVEVNCETDFVARTDTFRALARDVAMQVAAMNPLGMTVEEVPADAPGDRKQHALLEQPFIKDSSRTIGDLVKDAISQTGENVRITRFSRFELGSA
ncbi:MAG: translation elongation factor Ts [Dehalococcoidia bacterium]